MSNAKNKDVIFTHNGINFCIKIESHLTKSTAYSVKKKIIEGKFYIYPNLLNYDNIYINCIGGGAYDISAE